MQSERMKELIKKPETVTPLETKLLAYLLDTTTDVLMMRNQQIRLLKTRLRDALKRSLASQQRATKDFIWVTFWGGWAIIASLVLAVEMFYG